MASVEEGQVITDKSTVKSEVKVMDGEVVEQAMAKEETPKQNGNTEAEVVKTEISKTEVTKTEVTKTEVTKTEVVSLTPELTNKIVKQIEYYFGNFNLPRDKFLKEEVKKEDGWVEISVMLKFNRLVKLSTDQGLIFEALKSSNLMEINPAEKKMRRSPSKPLPDVAGENIREESICRTIYLKGFKKDGSVSLDTLLEFFKQYGTYETIIMRRFNNKITNQKGFKGSILIVYPDEESAKKLMEEDEIMFQNAPLLRKWYAEYLEEKKKEVEERVAYKEARAAKQADKSNTTVESDPDPKPSGTYLHLSGIKNTTSREDVKAALEKSIDDIAFVGLKRGDEECYVRLGTPFSNMEAVKKLFGKVEIGETEATVRAVTGDEEVGQMKLAKEARSNLIANSQKRKKNFGGGRGGRGGRGGHFKKRRQN